MRNIKFAGGEFYDFIACGDGCVYFAILWLLFYNIIDELEAGNNKYVNLDPKKCLENIFDNVKIINIDRKEEEPNR